jgi:hypothetical protein
MPKFLIEQYWPEESRDLDDLYLWFHEKKVKKDLELSAGDRVLFYEVADHPEKDVRGAKALFASGTLTDDRNYIPEPDQLSGGKRWIFGRRVQTEFAVPPKEGIPLQEVKNILGIDGWPQQGFGITEKEFEALEAALVRRQEQVNARQRDRGERTSEERIFADKRSGKIIASGALVDAAERVARLEKAHNSHKALLNKLAAVLKANGYKTTDNSQVDLFASGQGEEWIFEVKSTHEGNMLSQVRHGISQLYEYRYRYRRGLPEVELCLVLQSAPADGLGWLADYLRNDRGIHFCWPIPEGFGTLDAKALAFLRSRP